MAATRNLAVPQAMTDSGYFNTTTVQTSQLIAIEYYQSHVSGQGLEIHPKTTQENSRPLKLISRLKFGCSETIFKCWRLEYAII